MQSKYTLLTYLAVELEVTRKSELIATLNQYLY